MRPKTPNSFSSLRAHRAAGSKNATAQSSNDASFGDLREEARSSSRHSLRRRGTLPHQGMQIYEEMSETTNFCRVLHRFSALLARICPPFHTLVGAFRCRRAAFAENSTSFSQKLPIFGENSTTFRRKSTRLRALYPAVAAFSPIIGLHSPLIPHRLSNKPRLLLSSFAVTRRNHSVAPKGVK